MMASWKALLAMFAVGIALASGASYKISSWHTASLKAAWHKATDDAVAAAKTQTQAVCDANNQLTKDNANALQSKYNATLARYYKLLKYQAGNNSNPGTSASAAGRNNGAAATNVPNVSLNITDWADIAKRNDDQASALITLQDVVAGIYRANGQANLLPEAYQAAPSRGH